MRIIEYKYPSGAQHAQEARAACLGFFDGVHLGHRALILETVERANAAGLVPTVFTFPSETAELKSGAARIYSTEQKLRIFEQLGVGTVVICDFASVAGLSAREFVSDVLIRELGVRLALSGEDFRFGHLAQGDSAELSRLMRELGGDAVIHKTEYCTLPSGRVEISATLIRELLAAADVRGAVALLGAPYRIGGEVKGGLGLGRTYGFPTLNTDIGDSPLARGVYHTEVRIGGRSYTGLTNIGTCPTFGERAMHAESYLLDFDGDAYGERAEILFIDYIREERTFGSAEELRSEIDKNIKELLGRRSGGGE